MKESAKPSHTRISNGIDCIFLPAQGFKTLTLSVCFALPLNSKVAAAQALLPSLLRRGCKRWPSLSALASHVEELYGTAIMADARKLGCQHLLELSFRTPAPHLLEEGWPHITRVLKLAYELIAEPLIDQDGFEESVFASQRDQLEHTIRVQQDDRQNYALMRSEQACFPDSPYGVAELGSIEDVQALSAQGVAQHFERIREAAPLTIYASGAVDAARLRKSVESVFGKLQRVPDKKLIKLELNQPAQHFAQAAHSVEHLAGEQAYAVLCHSTGINGADPSFYAQRIANELFGGLSSSKLFRHVREELGLAYSIGSALSSTTGVSSAWAGCQVEHLDRVARAMQQSLDDLQNTRVQERELEAARKALLLNLGLVLDQPAWRIESAQLMQSMGYQRSFDEMREQIASVTREQVEMALARYKPRVEFRLAPKGL